MIKRNVVMFSILFFAVIAVGGTVAFISAMRQIVHANAVQALTQLIEKKKFQLEGAVDKEIAIAVKMAESPLIKRHFLQPDEDDTDIKALAFEEIAAYRQAFTGNTVFWISDIDKKYHFGDEYMYTLDPADPDSQWYVQNLHQKERYSFNVNYDVGIKKTMLWINVPVFEKEQTLGLAGTGIDVTGFIDTLYADYTKDMPFYLFNASFEITGAKDQGLVIEKKQLSDQFGKNSDSITNAAKNVSRTEIRTFVGDNAQYAVAYIPSLDWHIVAIMPITGSMYLNTSMTALFIAIMVVLILVFIIFNGFIFTILKPLIELEGIAAALADMDFTADIGYFRTDEIGTIQRALIKIRDSLHKAIDDLNAHLSTVTDNSKQLNTVIVESSEALGVIAGNMDVMKSETDTQMESVTQTSNAIEEIIKSIDSLDQAVHTQAAHITESSEAIEQMVANIASIRSVVSRVTKTTDTLSKSSASGHSMLIKLAEEISRIREQAATLQTANKTIADMAGQTNILAMNAAIEAAHAGESGKGFAVVAGEIRKLAELSGKESNAISEEIKKIEQEIQRITEVSNETVRSMDRMFTEIKAMDDSFAQVNQAVEEQAEGGSQILIALKTIQDMTGQVREGAGMIHRQSGSIQEEMAKLRRISQDVTSRAHEVKVASGNIASFLENTKALAG